MGMFDYVAYEAPCKKCGAPLTNWQSKDGDCVMERISFRDVRHFYTSCNTCGTWNEYRVIPPEGEWCVELVSQQPWEKPDEL